MTCFSHTTLCVIAVFVVLRCLFVSLSDMLVYSIHTAEDIVKLLSLPDSAIILVFWAPVPMPNSEGNPFSGAQNKGVGKFCDFQLKSPSILEMVGDRPIIAMNVIGSHRRYIEWWHFQWPWRTPNPVFKHGIFEVDYLKNLLCLTNKATTRH